MKYFYIIMLFFSILSCEKSYEVLGDGEIILESSDVSYNSGDSVLIFLVNDTGNPVFSHPPGGWNLSKKVDDEWKVIEPEVLIMVVLPPREWKDRRIQVFTRNIKEAGMYKYGMYLSWDKEAKHLNNLGMIYSNVFEIN